MFGGRGGWGWRGGEEAGGEFLVAIAWGEDECWVELADLVYQLGGQDLG